MVTAMNEWLTVADAAVLVHRDKTAIYRWIRSGLLVPHRDVLGRHYVQSHDVLRVESQQRLGRPVGSAKVRGML